MSSINDIEKQTIYLLTCVIHSKIPDRNVTKSIDLDRLYKFCKFHFITSIMCTALEKAGVKNKEFIQEKQKNIRNQIFFDVERERIFNEFEKNGIWYMPLKGVILKSIYPEPSMRQMSDNDILFDSSKHSDVKRIMKELDYTVKEYGISHHDTYYKQNILSFEMHRLLFYDYKYEYFYDYYKNIKAKLIKDENSNYSYHFSDEDFYIYMVAHNYKHFKNTGSGLRSLLDCYVYINNKGSNLNFNYINEQLEMLGITEFENQYRKLANKVFAENGFDKLTNEEIELLKEFTKSGAYGTIAQNTKKTIGKYFDTSDNKSKFGYLMSRLFPDMDFMKRFYPFFYKHKFLLPVGYFWRLLKGIVLKHKKIKTELEEVRKYDN